MKIVLVVSNLGNAGAQRSNVNLAQLLTERGHRVTVLTRTETRPDFFILGAGIERIAVDLGGTGRENVRALRYALDGLGPDVVIASGNKINVRTVLACRGLPARVIVVERNDPAQQPIGWRWELARVFAYARADRVVGISRGVLRYFWWLPSRKKALVHNTFPVHDIRKVPGESRRLVAVGRLSRIKGFDRLIEAWNVLAPRYPAWSVEVWGEGEARSELEELRDRYGLQGSFHLRGATTEPLVHMASADFLVVPSRSEGFGNVLVEAMSVGIPVVSFDCPSGPRDILTPGVDGFLVPDGRVDLLASAMSRLIEDAPLRESLGRAALESARRFRPEAHADRWEQLLQEVVGRDIR